MLKILIPSTYRKGLVQGVFLTRGPRKSLRLLTKNQYKDSVQKSEAYARQAETSDREKTFLQYMLSGIVEAPIDTQGFIMLPEHLVRYMDGDKGAPEWSVTKGLLELRIDHEHKKLKGLMIEALQEAQRNRIYEYVYSQVLDYIERDTCVDWGISVQEDLEKHNLPPMSAGSKISDVFMCAIATATIIGEFGEIAFNNYLPKEFEFYLDVVDIKVKDIEHLLCSDISSDELSRMHAKNYMRIRHLDDVQEYMKQIHGSLVQIYGTDDKSKAIDKIYESLVSVFETEDGSVFSGCGMGAQLSAYEYVRSGF